MKIITEDLLNNLSRQAQENSRLRMNYNLHETLEEPIHRMLNALEPGTYLPPHRHLNPDKTETYVVLRGSLMVAFFDDEGKILEKTELNPLKGNYGLEIQPGIWHSLVVLESNTVIFEIKEGPYQPLSPDNIAPWAPEVTDKERVGKFISQIITDKL